MFPAETRVRRITRFTRCDEWPVGRADGPRVCPLQFVQAAAAEFAENCCRLSIADCGAKKAVSTAIESRSSKKPAFGNVLSGRGLKNGRRRW